MCFVRAWPLVLGGSADGLRNGAPDPAARLLAREATVSDHRHTVHQQVRDPDTVLVWIGVRRQVAYLGRIEYRYIRAHPFGEHPHIRTAAPAGQGRPPSPVEALQPRQRSAGWPSEMAFCRMSIFLIQSQIEL